MVKNRKRKGAVAWIWIAGLTSIFICIIAFLVFNEPLHIIWDIIPQGNFTAAANTTMDRLEAGWNAWPIALVVGIFIWMIISSVSKDRYSYGG